MYSVKHLNTGRKMEYKQLIQFYDEKLKSLKSEDSKHFDFIKGYLNLIIDLYPDRIYPALEVARIYFEASDYERSIKIYNSILLSEPNVNQAKYGYLRCAARMASIDRIKTFYQKFDSCKFNEFLSYNRNLTIFSDLLESDNFECINTSNFSECLFINKIIDYDDFLVRVNNNLMKNNKNKILDAAKYYVENNGGKFLYISVDSLDDINNRNDLENEILTLDLKNKSNWDYDTSPNHIKHIYKDHINKRSDYIRDVFIGNRTFFKATRVLISDLESEIVNVNNGLRHTTDRPEIDCNKLILVGSSTLYGKGAEDSETICSFLQRKINVSSCNYKVENHSVPGNPLAVSVNNLLQTKISEGDLVVIFGYEKINNKGLNSFHCELSQAKREGRLFIDRFHFSPYGNQVISEYLYSLIIDNQTKCFKASLTDSKPLFGLNCVELVKYMVYKKSSSFCETEEMKDYLGEINNFRVKNVSNIGSVAVNCNPMTLGHLHLLEYAASKVEHLYVFVIEEDLSFFSFDVRFKLVKEGLAHIDSVTVLRGGKFICTELTYPEYFSKDDNNAVIADASMEAWYFAEFIAKALNISKIFLGDEPNCKITNQYNLKMQEILPDYGVSVNIIPRICIDDDVVSASAVRRLLEVSDFNAIKKIVPECTYNYLVQEYSNTPSVITGVIKISNE
jgi:citrate lyase synthetase/tetratricopeptide (TPR) repeat protein